MQPDDTFTRRVCAVLLADVTGYSALMGEDDERTAHAVQRLGTIVLGIITEAKGSGDARAGDAIFATFDSVVAAVEAALAIHRRLASEAIDGHHLQVRIGVHFGDVLQRDGAAFGDAINVAARLQTLARPGTVCISDGVFRHVRNRFDEKFVDLGMQQLKNISDRVHAYLIVPREIDQRVAWPRGPNVLLWGGAVLLLVLVGAAALLMTGPASYDRRGAGTTSTTPASPRVGVAPAAAPVAEPAAPVALGVMGFKSMGGDAQDDWRRELLRDGLNTQLSGLSHVKIYSKEFIDFLITRKGLTEIEAATQLGITKMLSGSVVVDGGTIRIETHVVDVASGVLEASYTTSSTEKEFVELPNKLALGVIARLNLPVSEDERRTLLAQRATDADAMKALLEAEGGATVPRPKEESSLRWLHDRLAPRPAWAGEDEAAIRAVLEQYRKASEAREVDELAAVYAEFPAEQRAAQLKYFENVKDLRVNVDNIDLAVVGDEAVASYTRTDDFIDAKTGRPMHVAVRLTKTLRKQEGGWKLVVK